jgi:hypothetical protein
MCSEHVPFRYLFSAKLTRNRPMIAAFVGGWSVPAGSGGRLRQLRAWGALASAEWGNTDESLPDGRNGSARLTCIDNENLLVSAKFSKGSREVLRRDGPGREGILLHRTHIVRKKIELPACLFAVPGQKNEDGIVGSDFLSELDRRASEFPASWRSYRADASVSVPRLTRWRAAQEGDKIRCRPGGLIGGALPLDPERFAARDPLRVLRSIHTRLALHFANS